MALALGCYITAYGPVLISRTAIEAAERIAAEAQKMEAHAYRLRRTASQSPDEPGAVGLRQEADRVDREAARRWEDAERLLLEAARADRYAAEPWQHLAAAVFQRWEKRPEADLLRCFSEYTDAMFRVAPDLNAEWLTAGDRYREVFRKTRTQSYLTKSVNSYHRAAELYPNSATCATNSPSL